MQTFRRFFITLILVGIVTLPAAVIIDFFWKQRDLSTDFLMEGFNSTPLDVLYFGDSTIRFYGERDVNRAGIDEFFREWSGLSVLTVANPGYSAILYSQYVRLLAKTRYKPKLVVIPVNLRGFSDSASKRPSVSFPLRQIYIKFRADGVLEWFKYLQYRFLGLEDRQNDEWNNKPVIHGSMNLGTNRQILDSSRINDFIDYAPEREPRYARQLSIKFRYHYMMDVGPNDPVLRHIDDTIGYLKKLGIPVIVYLTPINFQDGQRYAGTDFTDQVTRNFTVIRQRIESNGVRVLDLSCSLDPSNFIHKQDVFEHLNYNGRQFVAQQVAKTALELLRKEHK